MLMNRVNGCHGNHTFFHSAIEFIFEDKNFLHFWGPNKRFGTHEKLSCGGCKVGQISYPGYIHIVVCFEASFETSSKDNSNRKMVRIAPRQRSAPLLLKSIFGRKPKEVLFFNFTYYNILNPLECE